MKQSLSGYCYFIYNEGLIEFTAKDYAIFAYKAIGYSIKGLLNKILS